ncbi:MAG: hypothetical protein HN348_07455 [Proteobacteria bacterium]|jgi:hypothetical protein|nr:hypothetical protein [Pseudomonadota bacterium]
MRIESEDYLERPAEEIYPLVRDELPKLLPHLPDVETIELVSYDRESETRVRIVNRWKAKAKIPRAAAKFIPKEILNWTDYALWKDDENCVEYRLEGYGYEVTGVNYFTAENGGTRIKVTADVTLHPEKFKVPRFLFNKVFPLIEGVVKKAVQPNLTALARGLRAYYANQ